MVQSVTGGGGFAPVHQLHDWVSLDALHQIVQR
jgi:hypothetical protein